MPKRLTETNIWKNQRWFKKLHPHYKLAWKYLTDVCDHAGIWSVDYGQLVDDTGLDGFSLSEFIVSCNTDFDKETGKSIIRERVKLVNKTILWLTGFVRFQYEDKSFMINPAIPAVASALRILNGYGILNEALSKGYITLSQPYGNPLIRTKDKDKDKDIDKDKESINVSFEDFWNLYDKKRGDRSKLEKKWISLKNLDREKIMAYIPRYKEAQPDKTYRKDPSTFFNNQSWNDEIIFSKNGTNQQSVRKNGKSTGLHQVIASLKEDIESGA